MHGSRQIFIHQYTLVKHRSRVFFTHRYTLVKHRSRAVFTHRYTLVKHRSRAFFTHRYTLVKHRSRAVFTHRYTLVKHRSRAFFTHRYTLVKHRSRAVFTHRYTLVKHRSRAFFASPIYCGDASVLHTCTLRDVHWSRTHQMHCYQMPPPHPPHAMAGSCIREPGRTRGTEDTGDEGTEYPWRYPAYETQRQFLNLRGSF